MLLFNYGSNNLEQLAQRLGHAPQNPRPASAPGMKRVFRGHSRNWGGGVATLIGSPGAVTYGYVAEISEADKQVLDTYEGSRYALRDVVVDVEGKRIHAKAYLRLHAEDEPETTPSRAYLEAVAKTVGAFWTNANGSTVTWRDFGGRGRGRTRQNPSLVDKEQSEHPWLTRAQARHIVADHRRVGHNPALVDAHDVLREAVDAAVTRRLFRGTKKEADRVQRLQQFYMVTALTKKIGHGEPAPMKEWRAQTVGQEVVEWINYSRTYMEIYREKYGVDFLGEPMYPARDRTYELSAATVRALYECVDALDDEAAEWIVGYADRMARVTMRVRENPQENPVGVEKIPFEWGMTREHRRHQPAEEMPREQMLDIATLSNQRKLFREPLETALRDSVHSDNVFHTKRAVALLEAMAADAGLNVQDHLAGGHWSSDFASAIRRFLQKQTTLDQLAYYQTFLPIRVDFELPLEQLDAVLEVLARFVDPSDWRLRKLMVAEDDGERGQLLTQMTADLGVLANYSGHTQRYLDMRGPAQQVLEELSALLGVNFVGNRLKLGAKQNPGRNPTASVLDRINGRVQNHYEYFHGYPPNRIVQLGKAWVPGDLVCIGSGIDVGYDVKQQPSKKDGWYVHDFGSSVKVYRRARSGERYDRTIRNFPTELLVLGRNLGFTYEDADGKKHEVKGSSRKYLAVTPNRHTLVVVGPSGVEFVLEGGKMRVEDWIRD